MRINPNLIKTNCKFCKKEVSITGIKKHEKCCYLNQENIKLCPVCSSPIKNYRYSNTCSYSCANKLFRSGPNNGNWKEDRYKTTCFHYHKKECIVCGEQNIVEVHHLDENNKNNSPENLIPLCPTHHQYFHSRFKYLIEDKINQYIEKWEPTV